MGITSGRQPGRGRLLRLLGRVFGHAHAGAVLVAAGQPCRHVAGGQRVVLGELALSQRVVAVKLLEERPAWGKRRKKPYRKVEKKHFWTSSPKTTMNIIVLSVG